MDLSQHGGACRCLLRLRENEGDASTSDAAFIARFLPRYPEWHERPGVADVSAVCELARELGLAERVEIFRGYDRVLAEHSAGRSILVYTERSPEQIESLSARPCVALVVHMSTEAFSLWCPYPSGQSDTLPAAQRPWWERWLAIGLVLHPPAKTPSPAPRLNRDGHLFLAEKLT
jgi:hypothetical protein